MSLRAAFMGSPDFAVPSLRAVHRACDLRVVVCQPDRPAGRGRKLAAPATKIVAAELGLPVLQPSKMKDGTLAAALAEHRLDVIIVVAFGRILPPAILELAPHGCINVHGSVLPRWRGAAPIQRAVLAGDKETGVAIMMMDEGLDTGPVYTMTRTPIGPLETSGELFARLAEIGADALEAFLADFPSVPPPRPQDGDAATHAPPLRKEEGRVNWERPPAVLVDHVRGMDPWPAASCRRGDAPLKLYRARESARDVAGMAPGAVLGVDSEGLHVACLGGVIAIGELQPAGKRRMDAKAYCAGRPFDPGERLT